VAWVVLGCLLGATPAAAAEPVWEDDDETTQEDRSRSNDEEDDDGCALNNMLCYTFDPAELHPSVRRNWRLMYLLSLMPLGTLWGPLFVLGPSAPVDRDLALTFVAWQLAELSLLAVPVVGWVAAVAVHAWLGPVSMLRAWDRAAWTQRRGAPTAGAGPPAPRASPPPPPATAERRSRGPDGTTAREVPGKKGTSGAAVPAPTSWNTPLRQPSPRAGLQSLGASAGTALLTHAVGAPLSVVVAGGVTAALTAVFGVGTCGYGILLAVYGLYCCGPGGVVGVGACINTLAVISSTAVTAVAAALSAVAGWAAPVFSGGRRLPLLYLVMGGLVPVALGWVASVVVNGAGTTMALGLAGMGALRWMELLSVGQNTAWSFDNPPFRDAVILGSLAVGVGVAALVGGIGAILLGHLTGAGVQGLVSATAGRGRAPREGALQVDLLRVPPALRRDFDEPGAAPPPRPKPAEPLPDLDTWPPRSSAPVTPPPLPDEAPPAVGTPLPDPVDEPFLPDDLEGDEEL
jgi:hypothetical protein